LAACGGQFDARGPQGFFLTYTPPEKGFQQFCSLRGAKLCEAYLEKTAALSRSLFYRKL